LRSTGIGAALGIGRCGAIIGPGIGGAMLGAQWSNEAVFYAAAVPAAIATLSALLLAKAMNGAVEPKTPVLARH
jgi:AAHS family 4-hydroxybenzoate transporter-like MFS transporter